MKPQNLKTKIFLDSGDPEDTKSTLGALGFLDGQTTNPSLVAKHPMVAKCLDEGKSCSEEMVLGYYKEIVEEISSLLGEEKSVSLEVHAEAETPAEKMVEQGRELNTWLKTAHIKLPITSEGLKAAEILVKEGANVNMTLCFSQAQAAAVHGATRGAKQGQVFVSPFIGRLEDIGERGMDLIGNILRMYKEQGSHVEVLSASIRTLEQFLESIRVGSDMATLPGKVLKEWAESGAELPGENFSYKDENLKEITFQDIDLDKDWQEYDISHPLTDKGLKQFADDWNNLMNK